MAKKSPKKRAGKKSHVSEVLAVLLVAAAVLLFLSLVTFNPKDASWNSTPLQPTRNLIGVFGAHVGEFFLNWFGLAALVIPFLFIWIAVATRAFFSDHSEFPVRN